MKRNTTVTPVVKTVKNHKQFTWVFSGALNNNNTNKREGKLGGKGMAGIFGNGGNPLTDSGGKWGLIYTPPHQS